MKYRLDFRIGFAEVLSRDFEGAFAEAKGAVIQSAREGLWFWDPKGAAQFVPPHQIERASIVEIKEEPDSAGGEL